MIPNFTHILAGNYLCCRIFLLATLFTFIVIKMEINPPPNKQSSSKKTKIKKKKHEKGKRKKSKSSSKSKKHRRTRSSSDSSSSDEKYKQIRKEKKLKKKSKMKEQLKRSTETTKDDTKDNTDYNIPVDLMNNKCMAPQSKEEYDEKQSTIKRVFDEESGRYRLIRGDGEIIEEIVSKSRHEEINRQATKADGETFKQKLGLNKK